MRYILFRICVIICALNIISISMFSQITNPKVKDLPILLQKQNSQKTFIPQRIGKLSSSFRETDWSALIDSTWGEGASTAEKLAIFDTFWEKIDTKFPCFQDLDVNWDSLGTVYRTEVEGGVSKGRFAAIMNHLALSLKESHTYCDDKTVNRNTVLEPGIPLLYVGGWLETGHFGAGLTPLPDSTLLVYNTVPSHPLGLVPGDIVLGYEGIPWKDIYPELLKAQLPINGWWWGCSENAIHHTWLVSAGMNWHLFDTIDVIKYVSGDTLHLPTDALIGQNMSFTSLEQLEVPGIPIFDVQDILNGNVISSGIIEGTQIGYIYAWAWFGNAEDDFYNAVYSFMRGTEGIVIDFRYNGGGNMHLSNKGLELLFNTTIETVGFAARSDPEDHFAMTNGSPILYNIIGSTSTYYDKPIAVLTGPGCASSGDQVALRMKFHPEAKFFGKPTCAAFNSPALLLDNTDWKAVYALTDAFLVDEPDHYLTHDEFVVDEEVWLTKDDVAVGIDTVVETAIDWINNTNSISDPTIPEAITLYQNYPNPFNPTTEINFFLPAASEVKLNVYNINGQLVSELVKGSKEAGIHKVNFDASNFNSGMYFYTLEANGMSITKKMILAK